jgi:hypothetical protein
MQSPAFGGTGVVMAYASMVSIAAAEGLSLTILGRPHEQILIPAILD